MATFILLEPLDLRFVIVIHFIFLVSIVKVMFLLLSTHAAFSTFFIPTHLIMTSFILLILISEDKTMSLHEFILQQMIH